MNEEEYNEKINKHLFQAATCISRCLLGISFYQPLVPRCLANTKYASFPTQRYLFLFAFCARLWDQHSPTQPDAKPQHNLSLLVPDLLNHSL